jgi:hypothetical protein
MHATDISAKSYITKLSKTLLDGILEPLNDGDHTSFIGCETESEGVRVIELGRP